MDTDNSIPHYNQPLTKPASFIENELWIPEAESAEATLKRIMKDGLDWDKEISALPEVRDAGVPFVIRG